MTCHIAKYIAAIRNVMTNVHDLTRRLVSRTSFSAVRVARPSGQAIARITPDLICTSSPGSTGLTSTLVKISATIIRVAGETLLTLASMVANGVDTQGIRTTCVVLQTLIDI